MFIFDFNWQIQNLLNQFWWQINFLLLVILVVLGYLSYKKPVYAVGLTIIMLPTYLFRSEIFGIPFTFLELCIWVTFLGWIINTRANYKLLITNYQLPIALILVAATISIFVSPSLRAGGGLWKAYFVEPILFFLVLINITKTEENKKIILWSLGISTLVISLLAIWQKFTGFGIAEPIWTGPANRRVTSIFTSPNAVGLYLGPIVAIYLGWLIPDLQKAPFANRAFWQNIILKLLILIPALLAILFTVSQGTWLGLGAAVVFLAYFGWNSPPHLKNYQPKNIKEKIYKSLRCGGKKWTTLIILIIIILILIIPITRDTLWPIITFQDPAGQNRLILLQMSREHLTNNLKNFIFGAGHLGFAEIQNQMREPLKMEPLLYPHNIFLNFWLEIGLLGLVAFGWLIIKYFKAGLQQLKINRDWLTLGIIAAMITIIVHGLIDVPYFKNDLAVLFWIIIGLI